MKLDFLKCVTLMYMYKHFPFNINVTITAVTFHDLYAHKTQIWQPSLDRVSLHVLRTDLIRIQILIH